jgi:hypothetical protein
MKTYQEFLAYIEAGKNKTDRPLANNTRVRKVENDIAIRLHDTDIIVLHENGTATLNSGGWRTKTTKERINEYSTARIWQRLSIWYISDKRGNETLFYDGMTVSKDGYAIKPRQTARYEQQVKTIKKQAKQYARDYVEALKAGLVDYPSGGDCWACSLRTAEGKTVMGETHLQQHIDEKYYVPSLLVNAGREAGYRDEQIGLMGIGGHTVFIEPDRVIYKYLVKHLMGDIKE